MGINHQVKGFVWPFARLRPLAIQPTLFIGQFVVEPFAQPVWKMDIVRPRRLTLQGVIDPVFQQVGLQQV